MTRSIAMHIIIFIYTNQITQIGTTTESALVYGLNTLYRNHCIFFYLHLQISWNPTIYLRWLTRCALFCHTDAILLNFVRAFFCLKRPSLICLFHFTKRCVSISIHLLILALLDSLSLSLSEGTGINLENFER